MGMLSRNPIATPAERRIRREARSATLRELALALHQAGWTYAAIARALGVSRARVGQIVKKAKRLARDPKWYDVLPVRAQHFFWSQGWQQLDELAAARAVAQLSRREILRAPNIGNSTCGAVVGWLAGHGLKLSG